MQQLLNSLVPSLLEEPRTAIVEDCQPPPLTYSEEIDCAAYPTAFTGVQRKAPAKVAHLVQVRFCVQVLSFNVLLRFIHLTATSYTARV